MPLDQSHSKRAPDSDRSAAAGAGLGIPSYLIEEYWWAYLHPAAIGFFDHPWIVNLILWGNTRRLQRAAFDAFGRAPLAGRTLQVACVYGDLTPRLADRIDPAGALEVIDVVPKQLANLCGKVVRRLNVRLRRCDSSRMGAADGCFDRALLFFLLHEQPEPVRRATLREAIRVVRPGGRIVIVDYHRPSRWNPLRYFMGPLLRHLEPFALDLWRHELEAWLPEGATTVVQRRLLFGGLYQLLVLDVRPRAAAAGFAKL